jgi:uracil-DNA glycosylase family 4
MPMAGELTASILLIGEGPGKDEDDCGVPFVGKSGRLLRDALKRHNITDFAITNVCRCRPPNNRPPTGDEVSACIHYTREDMARMPNLKLVVAIGNVALRGLTGKQGITKCSGEEWEYEGKKLMPLMHPSYILQSQDKELDRFYDHVGRIPRIVTGQLTTDDDLGEYIVIKTFDDWVNFVQQLAKCRIFSYDTETTGLNPWDEGSAIKCIQFSYDLKVAYILPLTGEIFTPTEYQTVYSDLKYIFENKKIGKIGQNIKFDNLWMKVILDINVQGTVWDTKIAEYLLYGKGSTGLKDMAWRYSGLGGYEKRLEDSPEKIDGENLWRYGGIDADLTFRIYQTQLPLVKKDSGMEHLLKTLLVPVSDVLMKMEYNGIRLDLDKVRQANKDCEDLVLSLKEQMSALDEVKEYERAEEAEFNPNSHKQVAYILFKICGLKPTKQTDKGGDSTDKEVLQQYAASSKLASLLIDYSSYEQMRKTFLSELLAYQRNSRIHTTLWLTETTTGRTSCVPLSAEILTTAGWKSYKDLIIGEEVIGYNIFSNQLEKTKLLNIHTGRDYTQTMAYCHGKTRTIGIECTENHKWLLTNKRMLSIIEAKDIKKLRNGGWKLKLGTEISAQFGDDNNHFESALIGWALTDGDINQTSSGRYYLEITLVKQESINAIEDLLWGVKYSKSKYKNNGHGYKFRFGIGVDVFDPIWRKFLAFVDPVAYVMSLSPTARKAMWDAMMEADGSIKHYGGGKEYYRFGSGKTKKAQNVGDIFAALSILLGYPIHYRIRKTRTGTNFTNWEISQKLGKGPKYVGIKKLQDVWCPETELGTWIIRQNGVVGITGNSKKPNMQNMPKGERDILGLRSCFIADPGFHLVEADMNQHELRVMAEIANDAAMKEALATGDIHRATASAIFGVKPEDVTPDQRREAKTVNFGIIYGLTPYGLSQQLKITEEQAELWIYRFFEKYFMTKRYMEVTSAFCRKQGYVEALSGRRRYFPSYEEFDIKKLKEAINFPIQSLASDILLYNAIGIDRLLRGRRSFLCLEVHDSLLLNIHDDERDLIMEIQGLMATYAKQFMPFSSELKADVKIGENWGCMEDYK